MRLKMTFENSSVCNVPNVSWYGVPNSRTCNWKRLLPKLGNARWNCMCKSVSERT